MTGPRIPRVTTRGKPFAAGNPGRPKGARCRATIAAEALLDGEAESLTRKAVELALAGDTVALRLCLERLVPPRRDRPVVFNLPAVTRAGDHPEAIAAIISAVSAGELTPTEGEALAGLIERHRRSVEDISIDELLARIADVERRTGGKAVLIAERQP